jgi:hypothetical protein
MDREYTVRIGKSEFLITVQQIGAASWLARATRDDGEIIEFPGDDASYALERVKQHLIATDQSDSEAA